MKKFKKHLSLLLVGVMLLSFTSGGWANASALETSSEQEPRITSEITTTEDASVVLTSATTAVEPAEVPTAPDSASVPSEGESNSPEGSGTIAPANISPQEEQEITAFSTTEELLLLFKPYIVSSDPELFSGEEGLGFITGSLSLGTTILEDVTFTLHSSDAIELFPSIRGGVQQGIVVEQIDAHNLRLTVKEMTGNGDAGTTTFGAFGFAFPNGITENGTQGTMEVVSISCGGVTIDTSTQGWVSEDFDVTAKASPDPWALSNIKLTKNTSTHATSQTLALTRTASYPAPGSQYLPLTAAQYGKFIFGSTLSTLSGGEMPKTGYLNTETVEIVAQMELPKNANTNGNYLDFDPDLVSALSTPEALSNGVVMMDANGYTAAATSSKFKDYFNVGSNLLAGGMQVSVKLLPGGTTLEFSFKTLADISTTGTFTPYVTITGIHYAKPITAGETAAISGAYQLKYSKNGSDNLSRTSAGKNAPVELKMTGGATTTLNYTFNTSAFNPGSNPLTTFFNTYGQKSTQTWNYHRPGVDSNDGYGAGIGAGSITRTTISNTPIVRSGSGNSKVFLLPNRIWFDWNLTGAVVPNEVYKLTLTDDSAKGHFNLDEMSPIGFLVPQMGSGNTYEVYATINGSPVLVASSSTQLDARFGSTSVNVGGKSSSAAILKDTDATQITGITIHFMSADPASQPITIKGPVQIMFMANPAYTLPEGTSLRNFFNRYSLVGYDEGDISIASKSALTASVSFINGSSAKMNLIKSGKNVTTPGAGVITGDKVEYTLSATAPSTLGLNGYIGDFWLMDEIVSNLELDPNLKVTIVIKQMSYDSKLDLNKTIHTGLPTPTKQSIGGKTTLTYTGVSPIRDGKGLAPNQMLFAFTGIICENDSVTITYEGTVAAGAQPGEFVENRLQGATFTDVDTPSTIPSSWNLGPVTCKLPVRADDPTADIGITYTSAASYNSAGISKMLLNSNGFMNIRGGIMGGEPIDNPVYLVTLPDNATLTGGPVNVLRYDAISERYTAGAWTRNYGTGTSVPEALIETKYYDKNGIEIASPEGAKYVRLQYNQADFGKDTMLEFSLPIKAQDDGTNSTSAVTKEGSALFLNVTKDTGEFFNLHGITEPGTVRTTLAMNDASPLAKVANLGTTPSQDRFYVENKKNLTSISKNQTLAMSLTASPSTKIAKDARVTYTYTITSTGEAGAGGDVSLYAMTLLLPPGQEYDASTGYIYNTVTYKGLTILHNDMIIGPSGKPQQRLVVQFLENLADGKKFTISYTAKVTDISITEDYSLSEVPVQSYASLYAMPGEVTVSPASLSTGNVSVIPYEDDINSLWRADLAGLNPMNGWVRYETKQTLTYATPRINPGLTVTSDAVNDTVYNINTPVINWNINVSNGASALVNILDDYLFVVLPKGVTTADGNYMVSGPAPIASYTNELGNQVLQWKLDSPTLVAMNVGYINGITKNGNIQLKIKTVVKDKNLLGATTCQAYLIPSANKFDKNNIIVDKGSFVPAADVYMTANLTNSAISADILKKPGIAADKQLDITNVPGSVVSMSVTNGVNTSKSSKTYPLVPVNRDEIVTYEYTLKNNGVADYTTVELYNILPSTNDNSVLLTGKRGSAWSLDMVWNTSAADGFTITNDGAPVPSTSYTVFYSSQTANTLSGWQNLNWIDADSWPLDNKTPVSFRIKFAPDVSVNQTKTLSVSWKMKVPGDLSQGLVGQPAYNTAAFSMAQTISGNTGNYAGEPERCGVVLLGDTNLNLNFQLLLEDNTNPSTQTFSFVLERRAAADVWNPVDLNDSSIVLTGGTKKLDTGNFTLAATPGAMTNVVNITGLGEGEYRIVPIAPGDFSITGNTDGLYLYSETNGATIKLNFKKNGTPTETYSLTVNKQLVSAASSEQSTFSFNLEAFNGSSWSKVDLSEYTLSGGLNQKTSELFTITLLPGQTKSGIIQGLPEGRYRTVETGVDTSIYTVSGNNTEVQLDSTNPTDEVTIINTHKLTYSFALNPNTHKDFGTSQVGYTAPAAHLVEVTNTGTGDTGALDIKLSGSNADDFTILPTSITNIVAGSSTGETFTVVPKAGLAAGTYTATITVTGDTANPNKDELGSKTITVSFTVNALPTYTVTVVYEKRDGTSLGTDETINGVTEGTVLTAASNPALTKAFANYVFADWKAGTGTWNNNKNVSVTVNSNTTITLLYGQDKGGTDADVPGEEIDPEDPKPGTPDGKEDIDLVLHWVDEAGNALSSKSGSSYAKNIGEPFNYPGEPTIELDGKTYNFVGYNLGTAMDTTAATLSTATPIINSVAAGDNGKVITYVYELAPVYSVSLDLSPSYTFPAVTQGYAPVTEKTVTVTNTGNTATGDLDVSLSGTNATSFTLSKSDLTSIASPGTATFTVKPVDGLAAGTYTATITVTGDTANPNKDELGSKTITVSFTVNALPTYTVTVVYEKRDGTSLGTDETINGVTEGTVLTAASNPALTKAFANYVFADWKAGTGTWNNNKNVSVTVNSNTTITLLYGQDKGGTDADVPGEEINPEDPKPGTPDGKEDIDLVLHWVDEAGNALSSKSGSSYAKNIGEPFNYPGEPTIVHNSKTYNFVGYNLGTAMDTTAATLSTATPIINSVAAGDNGKVITYVYELAPVYSVSLDLSPSYTFPAVTQGYAPVTEKTVTVTNTGNTATGDLDVSLSGTNATSFILSKSDLTSIASPGTATFTVKPVDGLAAGTYTATITVTGDTANPNKDELGSKTITVSFTVNALPTYTVTVVYEKRDGTSLGTDETINGVTEGTVLTAASNPALTKDFANYVFADWKAGTGTWNNNKNVSVTVNSNTTITLLYGQDKGGTDADVPGEEIDPEDPKPGTPDGKEDIDLVLHWVDEEGNALSSKSGSSYAKNIGEPFNYPGEATIVHNSKTYNFVGYNLGTAMDTTAATLSTATPIINSVTANDNGKVITYVYELAPEYLQGKNIVLYVDEVGGMTPAEYIKQGVSKAEHTNPDGSISVITNLVVDFSLVEAKVGTYKATFTTPNGTTVTIDVRVIEREYPITYKLNNGQPDRTSASIAGVLINKQGNPSYEDHTFLGWYNGERLWNFEKDLMPKGALVLEAKWEKITSSTPETPVPPTPTSSVPSSRITSSTSSAPEPSSINNSPSNSPASAASAPTAVNNTASSVSSSEQNTDGTDLGGKNPSDQFLGGSNIPLGGFTLGGAWSLLNLILTILCSLMFLLMLVLFFGKRYEWRRLLAIVNLVLVIITIVLFIITTDFRLPMVFINRWSLLFIVLTVIQIVVLLVYQKENKKKEDELEEEI